MATEVPHATMCTDIELVRQSEQVVTLAKTRDQSDYSTFVAWARNEARKHCERGYCPKGKCRGHVDISEWELLSESNDEFTCRFSAE
ncbi:MAG: hypothetical protein ACR2RL_17455, partial [Gammaproteobacteria bacterium]